MPEVVSADIVLSLNYSFINSLQVSNPSIRIVQQHGDPHTQTLSFLMPPNVSGIE